jgi:uncharacterized membrane protein YkvA (DUF1232 family)
MNDEIGGAGGRGATTPEAGRPPDPPVGAARRRGPSTGLLSFYDRLRARMLDAADRQSHKLGKPVVEALLLAPDVFILLVRLALDRDVPPAARSLIGGALAYFILPVDLFPEAVVGAPGFLDDIVLAAAVLSQTLGGELEPYARKYWNGDQELRAVLHDIADSAQHLLGRNLYRRLRSTLARRGVRIDRR